MTDLVKTYRYLAGPGGRKIGFAAKEHNKLALRIVGLYLLHYSQPKVGKRLAIVVRKWRKRHNNSKR